MTITIMVAMKQHPRELTKHKELCRTWSAVDMRYPVDARCLLETLPDDPGVHVLMAIRRVTGRRQEVVHSVLPFLHGKVVRVARRRNACFNVRQTVSFGHCSHTFRLYNLFNKRSSLIYHVKFAFKKYNSIQAHCPCSFGICFDIII